MTPLVYPGLPMPVYSVKRLLADQVGMINLAFELTDGGDNSPLRSVYISPEELDSRRQAIKGPVPTIGHESTLITV